MESTTPPKFSREELFNLGPQRIYRNQFLNEISFPLGGIGTGSIGLTGRGSLKDFEIFNRPQMGSWYSKTFATIRVQLEGNSVVTKILEGPVPRPYTPLDGGGLHANGEGFPHMHSTEFRGEYPFAYIDFQADNFPVKVQLEAYNPFIPSDPDASGYPIAILHYHVTNLKPKSVNVAIMWSLLNINGAVSEHVRQTLPNVANIQPGRYQNKIVREGGITAIIFSNSAFNESHSQFGSIALASPNSQTSTTSYWKQTFPVFSHKDIWESFKQQGMLTERNADFANTSEPEAGALCVNETILPGQTKTLTFYISWYFPNFEKYWANRKNPPSWRNFYASQFKDAFDVVTHLHQKERQYYTESKQFHDALFNSTFPPYILDAIASNIAILKTATCVRLPDGTFYGWEGTNAKDGCCEGTCTHVWNYQQALPFLFPSLERSIHNANYRYNFLFPDEGALEFRIQLPLGSRHGWHKAAADGQMGGIIDVYREWRIYGNDSWLKEIWPQVKRALEFAFVDWDESRTGVLKSFQHNTYDIDWAGMNVHTTAYYLGALLAGAEIAGYLGDTKNAESYLQIFHQGEKYVDAHLFDGEYYIQLYDPKVAPVNQMGPGCLIDQLVGLQLARIAGLPNYLDNAHVKSALKSIFKYNYRPNMKEHENYGRLYAVNDEAATIICTWPKGGRPQIPFLYSDEVMNGFEYAYANHCILEGLLEEGLTVAKSIRDRYDGYGRNPWDEFECGHHYARSMASYGLLIALSGFEYHNGKGMLGFAPKLHQDHFRTFWSLDNVWGTWMQTKSTAELKVLYGQFDLKQLKLAVLSGIKSCSVKLAGHPISVKLNEVGMLDFTETIHLHKDDLLTFSW